MKGIIIATFLSLLFSSAGNGMPDVPAATVVRDDIETVSICLTCNGGAQLITIPRDQLNDPVDVGDQLEITAARGRFYCQIQMRDEGSGFEGPGYQFRSNDGSEFWTLFERDIGFRPDTLEQIVDDVIIPSGVPVVGDLPWREYTLIYFDNGTAEDDIVCDCPPEYECECSRYDDIFLAVVP